MFEPNNLTEAFSDVFFHLRDNLSSLDEKSIKQKIIQLDHYCTTTQTPKDEFDLFTQYTVGFLEDLVSSKLKFLIPTIIKKEEFIANKTYYLRWVGEKHYEETLKLYKLKS